MPDAHAQARDGDSSRGRRVAVPQPPRTSRPPHAARTADPRLAATSSHLASRDMDRASRYDARDQAGDRGGPRSPARYGDRRDGAIKRRPQSPQESLPALQPRAARGKRAEADADWPSTKWDQLSDVDYWAEVASDKPLTTTAQPAAQARPARPGPPRDGEARQGPRPSAAPERNRPARLPVRGAMQVAAAGLSPDAATAAEFVPVPHAAARAYPDVPKRPVSAPSGDSALAARARRDAVPPGPPRPEVLDDDPLTSPSFPRIPAADSRSYGPGRPDSPSSAPPGQPPYAAATQQFPTYAAPTYAAPTYSAPTYASPSGQFDSFGTTVPQPAAGYGTASWPPAAAYGGSARPAADRLGQPGSIAADHARSPLYQPAPLPGPGGSAGYARRAEQASPPAGSGSHRYSGHLPPASGVPPVPGLAQDAPAGNPYGSYVSPPAGSYLPPSPAGSYQLPSVPADSYLPSTQAIPPDAGRPAGSGSHRASSFAQPAVPGDASATLGGSTSGWYPDRAAPVPPTSAYLDVPRQLSSRGVPVGSYLNGNGHAERADYPEAQHEPSGYPPSGYTGMPHDPAGYAEPDPYGGDPYGRDPYGRDPHGYPGYGADS
jgi:hypothetical protein